MMCLSHESQLVIVILNVLHQIDAVICDIDWLIDWLGMLMQFGLRAGIRAVALVLILIESFSYEDDIYCF